MWAQEPTGSHHR